MRGHVHAAESTAHVVPELAFHELEQQKAGIRQRLRYLVYTNCVL